MSFNIKHLLDGAAPKSNAKKDPLVQQLLASGMVTAGGKPELYTPSLQNKLPTQHSPQAPQSPLDKYFDQLEMKDRLPDNMQWKPQGDDSGGGGGGSGSGGGGSVGVGVPNYGQMNPSFQSQYGNIQGLGVNDPQLMSGQQVADLFGVIFGRDQIKEILNQATKVKFDEWQQQTESLRDQSLTDYSAQYQQYLQQSRQNRQNAVRHGLQRGSNIAQEVLGQMGAQQAGAENQTMYQQQMGDIAAQRASQLASDEYNSMTMQNELASAMGSHAINQYSNEVQQQAAQLSYHGQLAQADATVQAAGISADAQIRSANAAAQAQRYYADATAKAQVEAAKQGFNAKDSEALAQYKGYEMYKNDGFADIVAWELALNRVTYNEALKLQKDWEARNNPPAPKIPTPGASYSGMTTSNSPSALTNRNRVM